ncbi:unnamed protein product [Ceratitis capitata]|uniref:(Mediterranean fruit fly) hypothetical protein n=1 Tax=Ceratitis capitata TaxID=7213 RepID=A0A811V4A9_CERCA|nr:unnamed protein product [Ceratitis capitata]
MFLSFELIQLENVFTILLAPGLIIKKLNEIASLGYGFAMEFTFEQHICVLPLELIEDNTFQKCLLPNEIFKKSGIHPGSWMKCMVKGVGYNKCYICQVYPRDIDRKSCYIDYAVGSAPIAELPETLYKLEAVDTYQQRVNSVNITLEITETFFKSRLRKYDLSMLNATTKQIMAQHYLSVGCAVRTKTAESFGITAINIDECSELNKDYIFQLESQTKVLIWNFIVKHRTVITNETPFFKHGYEFVWNELKDLLTSAKLKEIQSKCKSIRPHLNALLIGPPGCGKTLLIKAFMEEFNCNCFHISTDNVLHEYPGEAEAQLRKVFENAIHLTTKLKSKNTTVIIFENIDLLCPASNNISTVDSVNSNRICVQLFKLLDDLHNSPTDIFCIATTSNPSAISDGLRRPGRFQHEIVIDWPNEQIRRRIFSSMFESNQDKPFRKEKHIKKELLELVAKRTQGFVAGDIALLVQNIEQALLRQGDEIAMEVLVKTALTTVRPASVHGADVQVFKFVDGFETIGGMDNLKRTMEVSILAGLRRQQKFKYFGLQLPKGLLLYGPPGCAKTTFAKCLAKEANMTFISISTADVYSPYVGAAEKFISRIFDTARKNTPCLVFFDEIDTMAGRRPINSSSSSDVHVRILSTLLTEMDGVIDNSDDNNQHILVVAASNRPDMIDDALLRPGRLSKHIYVPAPDLQSRISLLQLIGKRMPFDGDVNIYGIANATELYTGADICNLCNEAALLAFERLSVESNEDENKIKASDFEIALRNSKSSLSTNQLSLYAKFQKKIERNEK